MSRPEGGLDRPARAHQPQWGAYEGSVAGLFSNRKPPSAAYATQSPVFHLGGFLASRPDYRQHATGNMGKHRVPTLRNVDLRPSADFAKCYGHNCYFKDLRNFVHFYNTRLILPVCAGSGARAGVDCWPPPEVDAKVNTEELGDLGLTIEDEEAIVAFLSTLSDGYRVLTPTP